MRALHLVGAAEDTGGILSVIRSLAAATAGVVAHETWVHTAFEQTRRPELRLRRSPAARDEDPSHPRLLWAAARALPGLLRLLRDEPFDIVHGHSRGAFPLMLGLAATRRRGLVFTNHTYAQRAAMYRWAARRPGIRWVFLTPNMARHYGVSPAAGQVEIISGCVADGFFERPLTGGGSPILRWVGLGNQVRWKRWDLAAEALRRLPDRWKGRITVTVRGPVVDDADSRRFAEELRALAVAPDLAGRFVVAGPTGDAAAVVGEADGFILPSTNEPCSVALMEALALGKPALVSASGGNLDLIEPGRTGLLFHPGDPDALADSMVRAASGVFRAARPEEIRASARPRSAAAMGARYVELYGRLAGAGAGRT